MLRMTSPGLSTSVCGTIGVVLRVGVGHKDPDAPDDDATRVLDPSRRYIEGFDQMVAKSSTPLDVIDVMLAKYPAYGNRYTLFAAAFSQFPS
jgi:hypothetical protein